MKLYIMSDTMTVVKALCTVQKEKKIGVSGASEVVVMHWFSITGFLAFALILIK